MNWLRSGFLSLARWLCWMTEVGASLNNTARLVFLMGLLDES